MLDVDDSADASDHLSDPERPSEASDDTARRKYGLFALSGVLCVAASIALAVVEGGSGEPVLVDEPDPFAELGSLAGDLKSAPAPVAPASVELSRLSFPSTLIGDERPRDGRVVRTRSVLVRNAAHATDIPASTLATEQTERLQRAARHDPLVAQAMPERTGAIAPHGTEGAFTLQVVTFEGRDLADQFADALRARGHRAYIAQAEVPGRSRYFRVRIGPFSTRHDAIEYQQRFEQTERMHTILVTGSSNK